MRKILLILTLFVVTENCNAQLFTKKRVLNNENFDKPSLSWGYFLGMNNYDYNFDYVSDTFDIQTEKSFGFNVGLIGNFRISDFFDIRFEPGLVMSNRNLIYDPLSFNQTDFQENIHKREIKSTYIHLPILLKISTKRVNNIKPASCVVKALVEATPISGPALVKSAKSDSLAKALVGTLQIVTEPK